MQPDDQDLPPAYATHCELYSYTHVHVDSNMQTLMKFSGGLASYCFTTLFSIHEQ